MTDTKLIYTKIPLIMSEIGHISKTGTNTQQGYKYRSIDDVYKKLNELLSKHKVTIVPACTHLEVSHYVDSKGAVVHKSVPTMGYTIYAEDGSSIFCSMPGEALDRSDKATAKAVSMAFKYMAMELFCIPIEGAAGDNEADNIEITAAKETKPVEKTLALVDLLRKINEADSAKALTTVAAAIAKAGLSEEDNDKLRAAYSAREGQLKTKAK